MSTIHQSAHPSVQPKSLLADPVNDKTPNDTLDAATTLEDADAIKIITAINKLVQSCTSTSKPKLWEPDPFDRSDPKKLHTFIFQCKLNFRDCKDFFNTEENKVNYTLSHLKGSHWIVSNLHFWTCMTMSGSQISIYSSWNSKTTSPLSTPKAKQKWNSRHFTCMKIIKL